MQTGAGAGWSIRGIGDVNSDGYDDIAVAAFNPKGVYIFYGAEFPDSFPDQFISYESFAASDYVGVIAPRIRFDSGAPGLCLSGTSIKFYSDIGDSFTASPVDSIVSQSGQFTIDPDFLTTGYVNNDSIGDVLTTEEGSSDTDYFQKVLLFLNPLTTDKNPDWVFEEQFLHRQIFNQGLIDYNGDGNTDIFVSINISGTTNDTGSYVYIFYGPSFTTTPNMILSPPLNQGVGINTSDFARIVESLGDVTGDGWDDLGVMWGQVLLYKGGPSTDTQFDYALANGYTQFGAAQDMNGDTWNDFYCGYGRVLSGAIDLYLGGIEFDTTYDFSIYKSDLPPFGTDEIGYRTTSAGDFNGDGFDDLMFSCRDTDPAHRQFVFIVAGNAGIKSPIKDRTDSPLPTSFRLYQNYPNPFNPTTTIAFELPHKTVVKLDILNVLGQRVRKLLNKTLSVGSYQIEWDGKNDSGKPVPSGTYFYRLVADDFSEAKKMVLVK